MLLDAGDEATMDAWEKALLANVKKPTSAELAADTTPVAAAAPEETTCCSCLLVVLLSCTESC